MKKELNTFYQQDLFLEAIVVLFIMIIVQQYRAQGAALKL